MTRRRVCAARFAVMTGTPYRPYAMRRAAASRTNCGGEIQYCRASVAMLAGRCPNRPSPTTSSSSSCSARGSSSAATVDQTGVSSSCSSSWAGTGAVSSEAGAGNGPTTTLSGCSSPSSLGRLSSYTAASPLPGLQVLDVLGVQVGGDAAQLLGQVQPDRVGLGLVALGELGQLGGHPARGQPEPAGAVPLAVDPAEVERLPLLRAGAVPGQLATPPA